MAGAVQHRPSLGKEAGQQNGDASSVLMVRRLRKTPLAPDAAHYGVVANFRPSMRLTRLLLGIESVRALVTDSQ
jgi:hypothetical protein